MAIRSGIGFDVHPMVEGRPLILGGVLVPFAKGLDGHSDGDVLTHAVIDALLGGGGLGDIGTHFPSSNPKFMGVASTTLLEETVRLVATNGWQPSYVDATVLAENPPLTVFIEQIKHSFSTHLNIDARLINIKAKTTDGLGFLGRGEGIGAMSIVTLESI